LDEELPFLILRHLWIEIHYLRRVNHVTRMYDLIAND